MNKRGMRLRPVLQVICTCLVVWVAGALPASSATRHVVLLFDERPELPGLAVLEADLVGTLVANSADHVTVYREAMDLSRFSSSTHQTALRDFLRAKYADKKIDVVVAIMGPALDFLLSHGDAIFPGARIVFCGIDRRELGERSLPSHVRGVLVKREFASTLELALSLHPQTQRVAIVAGASEFDTRLLEQARNELRAFENRVAFTQLTALPLQQLLAELSRLPPQTIVLFVSLFQDGAGAPFVPHDVVQRVSVAANAPVYGFVDQYLGRGIVGGNLYSVAAHGAQAAKLVLQALAGSAPSETSLSEVQSSEVLFDWRQMQRWGISESWLPAGSEIRFRDLTAWQTYRGYVLSIAAIVFAQSALIGWLLHEHRRRLRSEAAALELSGQPITAHEEERSRLARELHDDVTQRLASLAIEAGQEDATSHGPGGRGPRRAIQQGLVRLSEDVHALSYRLHPSILEDLGLTEALRSECERFSRTCPTRLDIEAGESTETVPRDAALCVFRIAQEGLRNIARHAKASRATVSLRRLNGGLQLLVSDNGAGFDPAGNRTRTSLGHASMRQRALLLGGKLDIVSTPSRGTTVLAWIPLREGRVEPPARAAS